MEPRGYTAMKSLTAVPCLQLRSSASAAEHSPDHKHTHILISYIDQMTLMTEVGPAISQASVSCRQLGPVSSGEYFSVRVVFGPAVQVSPPARTAARRAARGSGSSRPASSAAARRRSARSRSGRQQSTGNPAPHNPPLARILQGVKPFPLALEWGHAGGTWST